MKMDAAEPRLADLADELLAKAPRVELPFEYDYDTWVLAKDSMRFLIALVRRTRPARVIEFGSGLSTRMLSQELAAGGVVRSFDHVEAFARGTRESIARSPGRADVSVLYRPVGLGWFHGKLLPFYGIRPGDLDAVRDADLVIVDGPPQAWGREAALYAAYPAMRDGALLVLDDASRAGEQDAIAAWQHRYGAALEHVYIAQLGKGMLVVRKTSSRPQGHPFAAIDRLRAVRHSARALWRNRPARFRRASVRA
jgi:predicted O-methyltransferase YrrM